MKRKMPVGEWIFLHLVILPVYLLVGFGMIYGLLQLFKLLGLPHGQ